MNGQDKNNMELVSEWVEAANAHDVNRIVATLHPAYEYEIDKKTLKGLEKIKEEWKIFLIGLPDLQYKVELMIAGGDYVALRMRMTGTQTGPFRFIGTDSLEKAIPASNKPVDIPGGAFFEIKDGKIIRLWRYWDTLLFLRQIGQQS